MIITIIEIREMSILVESMAQSRTESRTESRIESRAQSERNSSSSSPTLSSCGKSSSSSSSCGTPCPPCISEDFSLHMFDNPRHTVPEGTVRVDRIRLQQLEYLERNLSTIIANGVQRAIHVEIDGYTESSCDEE